MDILKTLDDMEMVIEHGKKPLLQSDKIIIEPEMLYRYIDQMRGNLPDEIKDAQWVKKEEQRILTTAKEEYERILEEARVHAQKIANKTEIVRLAEEHAAEIIAEAQQTARDLTEGAFVYANDIMEKLEKQLTIYYDVVQEGRDEIQKSLQALQPDEE